LFISVVNLSLFTQNHILHSQMRYSVSRAYFLSKSFRQ